MKKGYTFKKLFWGSFWSQLMTIAAISFSLQLGTVIYYYTNEGTFSAYHAIAWGTWMLFCGVMRIVTKDDDKLAYKMMRQLFCRHQYEKTSIDKVLPPSKKLPIVRFIRIHRCRKCGKQKLKKTSVSY